MGNGIETKELIEPYAEDYIVPIIAVPKDDEAKFRFLGTGFFVGKRGHLVTCRHVVQQVAPNELLRCYQIASKHEISLRVVRIMDTHDLALCYGETRNSGAEMPLISEPYVHLGSDVETLGYLHEPKGEDRLPFYERYMKGYVTSIPASQDYVDSYELSFPALSGLSGAPLVYIFSFEGETENKPGIAGCIYGTRESTVVRHTESVREIETADHSDTEKEVTARIVELGLAYTVKALMKLFQQSDITITTYGDVDTL